jgi:hypothetical protein
MKTYISVYRLRKLINQYDKEEITLSRFAEIINQDVNRALGSAPVISSVCDIHKGTRCEKSFPSYTDGKCRECGGQAN